MKPTYADLQAENIRLRHKAAILTSALHLVGESPDATESYSYDGDRYTYRLFGALRADGGIVTVTFHHKGQHDSVSAYLFDEFDASVRVRPYTEYLTRLRCALERLGVKRSAMLGAPVQVP